MSSHLRFQTSVEPFSAETSRSNCTVAVPPAQKRKVSLSKTYHIAASARSKLTREAQRADHDLRLLVGHANLLDTLMLELANAEREQEAWFHETVGKAARVERPTHWADPINEEDIDDEDVLSDSESDSGSEEDVENDDAFDVIQTPSRVASPSVCITTTELDAVDECFFDDEYDDAHALVRTPSQQTLLVEPAHEEDSDPTPELVHEEDSDTDDEPTPIIPHQHTIVYDHENGLFIKKPIYYDRTQSPLPGSPDIDASLTEAYLIGHGPPLITSY